MIEFLCEFCDGWHVGNESHYGQWDDVLYYAVTCLTAGGYTEWYNLEWFNRPATSTH